MGCGKRGVVNRGKVNRSKVNRGAVNTNMGAVNRVYKTWVHAPVRQHPSPQADVTRYPTLPATLQCWKEQGSFLPEN